MAITSIDIVAENVSGTGGNGFAGCTEKKAEIPNLKTYLYSKPIGTPMKKSDLFTSATQKGIHLYVYTHMATYRLSLNIYNYIA